MRSKELTGLLAERLGYTQKETEALLDAFSAIVAARLNENDTVHLQGLGQWEVKKKEERVAVNPANGKRYLVPPKLIPVFKPGITIKSALKTSKGK